MESFEFKVDDHKRHYMKYNNNVSIMYKKENTYSNSNSG